MSLDRLMALVPPPTTPIDAGSPDQWPAIEEELGTALPQDYKQLINTYGSGMFGGYLYPKNPFMPSPHYLHLISGALSFAKSYEEGQRINPKGHPSIPAYPVVGGLLPWGQDDNCGLLCWLTIGLPDEWPIVILNEDYSEDYFEYRGSATDFLVDWLERKIEVWFFGDDEENPPPSMPFFTVPQWMVTNWAH